MDTNVEVPEQARTQVWETWVPPTRPPDTRKKGYQADLIYQWTGRSPTGLSGLGVWEQAEVY